MNVFTVDTAVSEDFVSSGAMFSPYRTWRYTLWRRWHFGRSNLMVIGLNPSTADATNDDPTVRRCIGYARRWGFGGLKMLNVFGLRSTDPKTLYISRDPIGPDNFAVIEHQAMIVTKSGGAVLAAWGNHGAYLHTSDRVRSLLTREQIPVACLGVTQSGQPKHPLYLRNDAEPVPFIGDGGRLVTAGLWRGVA